MINLNHISPETNAKPVWFLCTYILEKYFIIIIKSLDVSVADSSSRVARALHSGYQCWVSRACLRWRMSMFSLLSFFLSLSCPGGLLKWRLPPRWRHTRPGQRRVQRNKPVLHRGKWPASGGFFWMHLDQTRICICVCRLLGYTLYNTKLHIMDIACVFVTFQANGNDCI